jgi:hypothetical protein
MITYDLTPSDEKAFTVWFDEGKWSYLDCLTTLIECSVKLSMTPARNGGIFWSVTWKGQAAYLEGMTLSVQGRGLGDGLHVVTWLVSQFAMLSGPKIDLFLDHGIDGLLDGPAMAQNLADDDIPF